MYYLVLTCPKLDDNPAPRGICFLFPCSFYHSRILVFMTIFEIFSQSLLRAPANIRMTTQKGMWQMTKCYYWTDPDWALGQLLVLSQWLSYVPPVSSELVLISNHIYERSGAECLPALPMVISYSIGNYLWMQTVRRVLNQEVLDSRQVPYSPSQKAWESCLLIALLNHRHVDKLIEYRLKYQWVLEDKKEG